LLIPVLIEEAIHQITRIHNVVAFRVGSWISWRFVFLAVPEEDCRKNKFLRADSAKMRLNPAKKQNLVDKGLLAALVCCATLGQAMMV